MIAALRRNDPPSRGAPRPLSQPSTIPGHGKKRRGDPPAGRLRGQARNYRSLPLPIVVCDPRLAGWAGHCQTTLHLQPGTGATYTPVTQIIPETTFS